jgi:hypothetical protein|tara:strand:+ start:12293 stop:12982 length:690 start_codon:yes stop_codon:yes gene_type:complete
MSKAIIKALEERLRQIYVEGFTAEDDDTYVQGELSQAAIAYVMHDLPATLIADDDSMVEAMEDIWPWHTAWWKPSTNPQRNIIKAMALLAAEYDRIERTKAVARDATTPDILWLTNDEVFNHDDLQELIEERQLKVGDTVYFGTKRNAQATDFTTNLDELVIEGMQVQAEDDAGEVAEDYPSASEPQIQVLQTLIEAWATTYCDPDFYQVLNTQRYTITAADVEEASHD